MWVPDVFQRREGAVFPNPSVFCGEVAPDGDAEPWLNAPLGTIYLRVDSGNVAMFLKEADASVDGDWLTVTTS